MILSYRPLGQSEHQEIGAKVQINYPFPTTIVLEDGQVLEISLWRGRDYKVIQADKTERQSLIRLGLL